MCAAWNRCQNWIKSTNSISFSPQRIRIVFSSSDYSQIILEWSIELVYSVPISRAYGNRSMTSTRTYLSADLPNTYLDFESQATSGRKRRSHSPLTVASKHYETNFCGAA